VIQDEERLAAHLRVRVVRQQGCPQPKPKYHQHITTTWRSICTASSPLCFFFSHPLHRLPPRACPPPSGKVSGARSWADAATGNFTGVFIGSPGGPCPGDVPYELAGQIRGPRVVFQTSRSWIARSDCPVTTVGSGRFVSPTTVAIRWIATYTGPNGRPVRVRGEEIFQRI
jgi:hypothetical protein